MVMPNPEQMAGVKKVTEHIKGRIELNYTEGYVMLELKPTADEARKPANELLDQLATQLATQLNAFFNIEGKIEEIGEK